MLRSVLTELEKFEQYLELLNDGLSGGFELFHMLIM